MTTERTPSNEALIVAFLNREEPAIPALLPTGEPVLLVAIVEDRGCLNVDELRARGLAAVQAQGGTVDDKVFYPCPAELAADCVWEGGRL